MRELEGVALDGKKIIGAGKENFKTFVLNTTCLTDDQKTMMFDMMNSGNVGFLKTYVDNINLNDADIKKMKALIDEWPKNITIDIKKDNKTNSIITPEN